MNKLIYDKKRYNNQNVIILNTYKYSSCIINGELCYIDKYISKIPGKGTYEYSTIEKKELLKIAINIGELIYKNIDNISLKNNNLTNSNVYSKTIQDKLSLYLHEYGIPIPPKHIAHTKYNKKDFENFKKYYKDDKIVINTNIIVKTFLNIYLLYTIKHIIRNFKYNKLLKLINKIPELEEYKKYINKNQSKFETADNEEKLKMQENSKKLILGIIGYQNEIIRHQNILINSSDLYHETIFNEFFEDVKIPLSISDVDYLNTNYIGIINITDNPLFSTYKYLLEILPSKENLPILYFCDNCNSLMNTKSLLCYDCKKEVINEIKNRKRKNFEKLVSKLTRELEEDINYCPNIEHIYLDRKNHKNNYISKNK